MITSDHLKQLENDVLLAKDFWIWHQNSGPDVPFSNALYSDISNRLYDAYQAVYEAYITATHERRMMWFKTLKTAPVTDLDPTPITLPQGRYAGVVNQTGRYIYVEALHRDFSFAPDDVMAFPAALIKSGLRVECSISKSYTTALNIVVVGVEASRAAYDAKCIPAAPRIDLTRRPRNLDEARAQADQRKKDALQRELARKNPHTPQDTRVTFGEAGYEMDGPKSDYDNIDMTF